MSIVDQLVTKLVQKARTKSVRLCPMDDLDNDDDDDDENHDKKHERKDRQPPDYSNQRSIENFPIKHQVVSKGWWRYSSPSGKSKWVIVLILIPPLVWHYVHRWYPMEWNYLDEHDMYNCERASYTMIVLYTTWFVCRKEWNLALPQLLELLR